MLKLNKIQLIQLILLYSFLLAAALFCYNFNSLWGPTRKRAFQCFDESIRQPFVLEDTITPLQLNLLSIYLPILVIAVAEFGLSLCQRNGNCSWLFKSILKFIVVLTLFLVGLSVERILKSYVKYKMARLRPNFLTVCEPIDMDGNKCFTFDLATMNEYQCSDNDYPKWAVNTAFHSFPSGHASISAYGMLFITCYLQLLYQQLKRSLASLLLIMRIIQVCCVFTALFVAVSRVFDYRHHVSDVCAGFLLGSTMAISMNWYLKSHLEHINVWLRKVFHHSTATSNEEAIKVTCLNDNVIAEKEAQYSVV